jgi:hypothetical protein
MKKLMAMAAAFTVLGLVGGCGGESAESLIKQQIQATNDMADALGSAKDFNDPKVKAAKEKLDKLAESWKKLPKEQQEEAVKKHGTELAAAQLKLAQKVGAAGLKEVGNILGDLGKGFGDLGKGLGGDLDKAGKDAKEAADKAAKEAADKAKDLFGK